MKEREKEGKIVTKVSLKNHNLLVNNNTNFDARMILLCRTLGKGFGMRPN
jgi:hypothetical protein